jgi:hypothetical protein
MKRFWKAPNEKIKLGNKVETSWRKINNLLNMFRKYYSLTTQIQAASKHHIKVKLIQKSLKIHIFRGTKFTLAETKLCKSYPKIKTIHVI